MPIVLPGEFAGISEEIASGENTFEENGAIYTAVLGAPVVNKTSRTVNVKPVKEVRMLKKGDVVIGAVNELYEQIAQVQVLEVEGDARVSVDSKFAFLRISEIQKGYVESLRDHIRIGDVIRAKVIDITDLGTYLTMTFPEYGVVSATCTHCRGETERTGPLFTCIQCGAKEQRKVAQVE